MSTIFRLVVFGITLIQALVAASPLASTPVPRYFRRHPVSRRELSVDDIQRELGPILSNGSTIFGPLDPSFSNATERFNVLAPPDIEVVVVPALELDVSKIVKYCADNSIEFLAYSRGHGVTSSLGSFKGLEINLRQLNGITIAADGQSALLQGGTNNDQVMRTLWDRGFVTSTGSTPCVGVLGPGLGGGHGRYEGLYGLVSDQFIHLNVVLANGSTIGVNETSHSDLFWAMKGAGHNFGIVTSAQFKINPRKVETWNYHSYYWTEDKLEAVFEALNEFHRSDNGTTPPLMGVEAGAVVMNSSVSEADASLYWSFTYAGPAEDAGKLLEPFNAIENVGEEVGDVPYPELSAAQRVDAAHGGCASGKYASSTLLMGEYNITAQRKAYEIFNQWAKEYPDLAKFSRYYYEGYATKGVQDIDSASSAYPHRDKIHLVYFTALVEESDLLDSAQKMAKDAWDIWVEGESTNEPATYVNYATGKSFESLESVYGYEPWRLVRLHELKAKYDPQNRFRYYVPIEN